MNKPKSKGRGQKSISLMALEFLYFQGPMTYVAITELVREQPSCSKYTTKSVHTKLLEMESKNLVTRDAKGVWYLIEGVTPQTLSTGEKEMNTEGPEEEIPGEEAGVSEEEEGTTEEGAPAAVAKPARRGNIPAVPKAPVALDQKQMFIKHMSDIGVGPKEAIPTIADLFFAGEIDDLDWLNTVLKRHAAGYVSPHQRNLIVGFWAKTRGLPYSEDEESWKVPDKTGKGLAKDKAGAKEEKPAHPMDLGIGWKVGKDRAGDWLPQQGGPLTYEDALDRAERRATIAAYSTGGGDEESEEAPEGETAAPTKKGKAAAPPFVETLMLKMFDNMMDGGGGKGSASDAKVEALEGQIAAMRDDRMEERFQNMEGLIAQAVSHNPWDDFSSFQQQAQRFGYAPNVVTDQSPAVQLIKDSTEKLDRNISRLLGIVERTALRSEEFTPEETRTTGARDQKAGELLSTVQGRDRSRQLRRDAFGV
ncbi:hypothetical protein ES703_106410 [subsurface metagenome]